MGADAWITLAVTAVVLALLVSGRASPALVILAGSVTLMVVGVIDADQAFEGFSNSAPITVAALFVLAAAVEKTGALTPLLRRTLGTRGTIRRPLLRLVGPTTAASAFLNNTPIVAMLVPQVTAWAEQRNVSVSRMLMPISFAALLGGVVTIIGTSTNLVVSGQMETYDLEPIGFFEIGKLGLPVAVLGVLVMVLLTPKLLPPRRTPREELAEEGRRFSLEMVVVPGGPVAGRTVEQARLRHLHGTFLAAVDRGDSVVAPVRPETVLMAGDRLRFVGRASDVLDLQGRAGLASAEEPHIREVGSGDVRFYEAVVGARSPVAGSTLRETDFRRRYQAAVVGIHRDGHLIEEQFGQVVLRAGDTLMLMADSGFRDRWQHRSDFLLVADVEGSPPLPRGRAWIPIVTLVAVVVLAATETVPIFEGSLVAALLMVVLGVLTPSEAARSIDLEVIVVIAAAFGLAAAMESSGLAQTVADGMTSAFGAWGDRGVLLGVVLAVVVLTELITNNAAALLMLPIALAAAAETSLDPRGVAIAIAIGASCSFLTPIGYQTNMMVYGPGGYRFTDYARLGAPLTVLVVATTVLLVPVVWPG